jgi:hypothetical protein
MKKLIAIFAVLLLAAPAMAADWSFYGSQRMSTFYVADDFGDFPPASGEDDDWGLDWDFQGNSRLGARVKADKVTGHIELGLKGTDGGDIDVGTRRAYGIWKFSDNAGLKVGKDYSPVTRFISGQVFKSDDGLLGAGNFYGKRPGQIGLQLGNFEIAAITNPLRGSNPDLSTSTDKNIAYKVTDANGNTVTAPGVNVSSSDPDYNLPKIEASWLLKLGSFDIRPFGGVNYYKVEEGNSTLTDDIDVWSYVVGLDSMLNIGAFYIGGQVAYGINWDNANWANARAGTAGSFAILDGTDDTKDCMSYTGMLVAGLNFTPQMKFEAGAGYRADDPDDVDGINKDEMWQIYGQLVLTLAPGVYLVPEAGYLDKMDNFAGDDEGYQWYAGAKWQIDF